MLAWVRRRTTASQSRNCPSTRWTGSYGEYIRTRTKRKGPDELDVEPEWATEAVMDARAVIRRDKASRSGEGLRVTGHSPGADRVLVVIVIPKEHPPTGAWWGVNAWSGQRA